MKYKKGDLVLIKKKVKQRVFGDMENYLGKIAKIEIVTPTGYRINNWNWSEYSIECKIDSELGRLLYG